MRHPAKLALYCAIIAATPLTVACSQSDPSPESAASTRDAGTQSLGAALGELNETSILRDAMTETELAGILDSPASYTILAPTDAAFNALGDDAEGLTDDEQKPLLLALVRNHLLPGHLTPETIGSAIDAQEGAVTMTTLGDGEVTFARDGEGLTVAFGDGPQARIVGEPVATNNGVIIPLDTVLVPRNAG
ncbi:fasciclin domain-containing protein [Qipengyuania sp. XHP0207]|uniref:fasciclin domain-containing protein n=1 Tax=Qipengyuania sp. XHP0207 TaxID=3038078 RepID=UPI00241D82DF|nr:fasciclin domain-containing protein [Qipengyuania sp. XHP0207]MDG5749001.1 fasciclin domain-containing protein [Qipengyuania sp. XHP0207]